MVFILFRFQGEKNEGFGVLYANMKCGIFAIKELADFLKERAKLEEENSKAHAKLSKQVKQAEMAIAMNCRFNDLPNFFNFFYKKIYFIVRKLTFKKY